MTKKTSILDKILELLVCEYGHRQVLERLVAMQAGKDKHSQGTKKNEKSANKTKLKTASQIVHNLKIEDSSRRSLIFSIANQFDMQIFLPTIGIVKSFLDSRGYTGTVPKSRQAAAKIIINVLNEASTNDLKVIVDNEQFSGPSQLQSLSNAISSAGSSLRGRNID